MKIRLIYVAVLAVLATLQLSIASDVQRPDKMLASKKLTGHLVGYQEGDYLHAIVRTEQGSEQSFFVDDEICFLASNRDQMLAIEYRELERFFPEGSGYYPANVIQTISAGAGERRWIRTTGTHPTSSEQAGCRRALRAAFNHHT